ncbi:MAG TPA: carboxymuconolactone decarboxylase family protein [Actinospica sp.]|jgi:alkylhydroperoxidase family enzyme|nr:carboxymuconolactone decarboxylase family protein [Actinospica sp.]
MSEPYLPPIENPKGAPRKLVFALMRRQMGKVPTPFAVFGGRMPLSFLSFMGKISRLDKKLKLPQQTVILVREQVAGTNACLFCQDFARWYALDKKLIGAERLDALPGYRTSPLFTDAERAALDYASELTDEKHVSPETFQRLTEFYSEREICELAWIVATEHVYNISNHGLNIGSDGFCELREQQNPVVAERPGASV